MTKSWYVYIVECIDGSLYCGITTDISRRLHEHNETRRGSKYVRSRRPAILKHKEATNCRSSALKRENIIKKMSRIKKLELIRDFSLTKVE
jgi:putative endonuclease